MRAWLLQVLQGWQAQCFTQFMVVPSTRFAQGPSAMLKLPLGRL